MAKAKKGQHSTQQKSKKKEWIPVEWQVILMFVALGLILLILGLVFRNSGPESLDWPMVEGKVIETNVVSSDGAKEGYSVTVSYTYTVNEVTYTSDKYDLNGAFTTSSHRLAENKAAAFPTDRKIAVFYNTANPEVAVLDPGNNSSQWLLMGSAIIGGLGLFATLMLVTIKKKNKQVKPKSSYTFKK